MEGYGGIYILSYPSFLNKKYMSTQINDKNKKEKQKAERQRRQDQERVKQKEVEQRQQGTIGSTDEKVAKAILQQDVEFKIGRRTIKAKQPSVGTIIGLSADIARLPMSFKVADKEQVFYTAIAEAKDFKLVADILSNMIVGCKKGVINSIRRKYFKWLILNHATAKQVFNAYVTLINLMDISFFLSTITSLKEIRLLQPTK